MRSILKQECIPVGCVPPAAVAVTGGVSTPPGAETPLLEQVPPPGCGPGDPPRPDPPQLPPWVWAWKPARHAGIPPPWRPAARYAGIPPAMYAGIAPPPPVDRHTRVKT